MKQDKSLDVQRLGLCIESANRKLRATGKSVCIGAAEELEVAYQLFLDVPEDNHTDVTHTPGPWGVNYSRFSEVRTADGAVIATCNKLSGLVNLQANARLIAAAPELLAALQWVMRAAAEDSPAMWSACSAAIAKAQGGAAK